MLPVQYVSGLRVVKTCRSGIPVHHLEIHAIVVRMTFDARCTGRARARICCVQTAVLLQLGRNLFVAFKTPERRRARRHFMTFRTVRVSAQALMSFGKWPRRYLAVGSPCIAACQN